MKMVTELKAEILNGQHPEKFTAEEMTSGHVIAAVEYVYEYVAGPKSFDFMSQMWHEINKNIKSGKGKSPEYQLTAGQAKGVLNVMRAELLREQEAAKAKLTQIADGEYEMGEFRFKIETQPENADFAPGETIISYPGKKKPWLGFGFVRGNKLQAWSRFKDDPDSQTMIAIANLLVVSGKTMTVAANAAA